MKGDVEELLSAFQQQSLYFDQQTPEYFHPAAQRAWRWMARPWRASDSYILSLKRSASCDRMFILRR